MPVSAAQPTELVLVAMGVPIYSARGLTQTLDRIGASAQLKRTVNGELDDVSAEKFRKFTTTISGDDVEPPATDGWWPGMPLEVQCAYELSYLTAVGQADRPVAASRVSGLFTLYRPILQMRIVKLTGEFREWEAGNRWSIELEEI